MTEIQCKIPIAMLVSTLSLVWNYLLTSDTSPTWDDTSAWGLPICFHVLAWMQSPNYLHRPLHILQCTYKLGEFVFDLTSKTTSIWSSGSSFPSLLFYFFGQKLVVCKLWRVNLKQNTTHRWDHRYVCGAKGSEWLFSKIGSKVPWNACHF